MKTKWLLLIPIITLSAFLFSACTKTDESTKNADELGFSNEEEITEDVFSYSDSLSNAEVKITQTYKLNQEFKVKFLTQDPKGEGYAEFKARSIKEVSSVDERAPTEGKKLVLVEISLRGNPQNKGQPSTFNQIGDNPSPQFVLYDKSKNQSFVEETYYSDAYTISKNLFELSKITLDQDSWVNTAIVFEVDKKLPLNLALRFTNLDGSAEFYAIE
jgi:hypothetical protein